MMGNISHTKINSDPASKDSELNRQDPNDGPREHYDLSSRKAEIDNSVYVAHKIQCKRICRDEKHASKSFT